MKQIRYRFDDGPGYDYALGPVESIESAACYTDAIRLLFNMEYPEGTRTVRVTEHDGSWTEFFVVDTDD